MRADGGDGRVEVSSCGRSLDPGPGPYPGAHGRRDAENGVQGVWWAACRLNPAREKLLTSEASTACLGQHLVFVRWA